MINIDSVGHSKARVQSAIFAAGFLLAVCSLRINAAPPELSLDSPIEEFSSAAGDEFMALCSMLDRPCGIEQKRRGDFQIKSGLKIHFEKTSPRKILDHIVRLHPDYKWTARDGMLIIEPANRATPDLLATKLDHVSIHGISSYKTVKLAFKQAGIPVSSFGSGNPQFSPIDLEMQNVSVRDVLNAIAKADGHVLWGFCAPAPGSQLSSFSLGTWRNSGAQ